MSPIIHAINIGTLAAWLSLAGFGTVGIVVPAASAILDEITKVEDPYASLDTTVLTEDFSIGDPPTTQETEAGTTGKADETEVPFAEQETLPNPPEMPETAEITPLPRLPDLPPPTGRSAEPAPIPAKTQPSTTPKNQLPTRSKAPTSPTGGSLQGKTNAAGKSGDGSRNGNTGLSDAKRLAGGRMPGPSYPAEARAKGQSGTVVVEFIVGENGSVVSAYAKRPSPWPVLNERAVSCVRRWKFPPGKITKYSRPIVFQLN